MNIFKKNNFNKTGDCSGFTLMEMMLAIGIFVFIATIGMPAYNNIRSNVAVKNDSEEIVNALRTAQNRAIVSMDGIEHGVYFGIDDYVLFSGDWSAPVSQTVYSLKSGITVLSGSGTNVTFDRLTGETSNATIVIGRDINDQKTIEIEAGGAIFKL